MNYYVIAKSGLILCLSCGFEEGSILEAKYIFNEKTLYFPIILWKLLIENKKIVLKQEYNSYENEVCGDDFIGCIT